MLCLLFQSSSPCCHMHMTEIKFIIQLWIDTGLRHDPHRTQVQKDFICKVLEDFVAIFLILLTGRAPQKYRGTSPMPISCPNRKHSLTHVSLFQGLHMKNYACQWSWNSELDFQLWKNMHAHLPSKDFFFFQGSHSQLFSLLQHLSQPEVNSVGQLDYHN